MWTEAVTFAAVWNRAVAARGDSTFLVFEAADGSVASYSYAEFDGVVTRLASVFDEHDVGHGSAIHLVLANSPWFVAVWLAAARTGASIVPSDPMAPAAELGTHRFRTETEVAFCSTDRRDVYEQSLDDGDAVVVVSVDENHFDTGSAIALVEAAFALGAPVRHPKRRDDVETYVIGSEPRDVDLLDRLAVMFTSGTTGDPKGVEITQANYAFAGKTMAEAAALGPEHRQLVVLPLFHANAQYYSFASAIWVGASVGLVHRFSASGFLASAARLGATHASLFAAPIRMILSKADTGQRLALQHCWFAQNLTAEQHRRFGELIGCAPRQLYGMTETIAAVLTDRSNDPKPDVMGTPTPGCAVELSGNDLLVGGQRGITLFAGYLDAPDITIDSFDTGGWFRTGDHAEQTRDGSYRFVGRRSDVLKVAGENVSIVEVEAVLATCPGVFEVAVVGAPDPIRDEVPVAYVVAEPSVTLDAGDLAAFCAAALTKAKRPTAFIIVDQLPRTSVGKIKKFLLTPTPGDAT